MSKPGLINKMLAPLEIDAACFGKLDLAGGSVQQPQTYGFFQAGDSTRNGGNCQPNCFACAPEPAGLDVLDKQGPVVQQLHLLLRKLDRSSWISLLYVSPVPSDD